MENQKQNEVQIISQVDSLEVINRSEIDMQIATAKKYPRNLGKVIDEIRTIAGNDVDTAASCFYAVPRDGQMIEGLSVRLAEVVAGAWGNIRVASRVVGNDGRTITGQAVCMDLEKNVAVCKEVKVGILNKYGQRYGENMQVTVGNAACAKAFRNAVFSVVPRAVLKRAIDEIKKVALGSEHNIEELRSRAITYFKNQGVTEKDLAEFMERGSVLELSKEDIMTLMGIATAINEGTTNIQEGILEPLRQRRAEKEAEKKQNDNQKKVAAAMNKGKKNAAAAQDIDFEEVAAEDNSSEQPQNS